MCEALTDNYLSGAYRRLRLAMLFLFLAGGLPIWAIYGHSAGVGFVIGAAVSALSFLWLQQSARALLARIAKAEGQSSGVSMVFRFVLRYILIAAAGYVITLGSQSSLYGFLAGLMLWVVALLLEAACQAAYGIRHSL